MGRELFIWDFHRDSLRCQNNRGPYLCNSPKGTVRHTKACLDADQPHLREQRDVLALRDLLGFFYESAAWEVYIGSVKNLVRLDSRPVTQTDVLSFQA